MTETAWIPHTRRVMRRGKPYLYFVTAWDFRGLPILTRLPALDDPAFETEYQALLAEKEARKAEEAKAARLRATDLARKKIEEVNFQRAKKAREKRLAEEFLATKRFVYFIVAQSGPIKIGTAKNPKERLQTLATGHPEHLTLIAMIEGDKELEKSYHERFAQYRIRGEWFEGHRSIWDEITRIHQEAENENEKLHWKPF